MAGGDVFRAQLVGAVDQPAELQVFIAHHAGIGRASGLVFIGEILDDVLLEIRRLVDEIIGDIQLLADRAGVGHGLGAAAFVLGAIDAILRPELESDADDLVALFQQQRGRGGGIHSSAHAQTTRGRFYEFIEGHYTMRQGE